MSLEHEFFLIPKDLKLEDCFDWYSENRYTWKDKVGIDDSLIRYINDTLKWIPSLKQGKTSEFYGLDYYGETIINYSGAKKLYQVILAWIDIFSAAPSKFKLASELIWVEENETDGYWKREYVEYDRELVVENFKKISQFAEVTQQGNNFILHIGI
ncbi:hypothetical protein SAMN02745163_02468 [Clostridium cavendishii DSM 21758]|uniref:Uncharacterized protein n=1 Tax=Clostridium cavendishii DSM 21758 TaxID=1121302 RepID=A0A1M6LRI1_9CLOT|nr:hypothetical protein [Clostridium cavendishii]SHJ73827.1 hypothetical protein SAMN02745163_02468 [Clostridium cavendishii DSM 21758]